MKFIANYDHEYAQDHIFILIATPGVTSRNWLADLLRFNKINGFKLGVLFGGHIWPSRCHELQLTPVQYRWLICRGEYSVRKFKVRVVKMS